MASLTLETKKDILRDFLLEAADDDFLKWLEGNGYFTAPASKSHHGSEEGPFMSTLFRWRMSSSTSQRNWG